MGKHKKQHRVVGRRRNGLPELVERDLGGGWHGFGTMEGVEISPELGELLDELARSACPICRAGGVHTDGTIH